MGFLHDGLPESLSLGSHPVTKRSAALSLLRRQRRAGEEQSDAKAVHIAAIIIRQSVHVISIRQAQFPHDTDDVLEIWQEYVQSPSVSLDYQNYEDEFANLPGNYGAPSGAILLGELRGKTAGCVAMRRVRDGICEMKRLYVRPAARGFGLGRMLTKSLIFQAKASGYFEMRLDVLSEFEAAQKLYSELGFKPAEPVSYNPIPGTKYLGLLLT